MAHVPWPMAHDVRAAFRSLWHARRAASWVIGSLVAGLTMAIASLAFVNALLFLPFPASRYCECWAAR